MITDTELVFIVNIFCLFLRAIILLVGFVLSTRKSAFAIWSEERLSVTNSEEVQASKIVYREIH